MQAGQGAPGGPGLNGPRLREAAVRPGKVRHGVWASWGLAQPGPGPRPAARPAALPWLLSLGSGPGPEACGERRRDQSSLARGRGTVPTPEAFSLEQRGAPRRQVPADPQQAGSHPPVRPVVARHASRLRRAGGLSAVSCPESHPGHTLRPTVAGSPWGLLGHFPTSPLVGASRGLSAPSSGTSTAPGPQFLLLCAPSALHTPESRGSCLAVSPKSPALLAPTDPGSSGPGHQCSEETDEDNRGRGRRSATPAGALPHEEPAGRARPAGVDRWRGAALLKKGPEAAA